MKKKILIIEDEEYLSEMYKIKLVAEGYDVIIANDGKEGLEMAYLEQPDLILLDLMMPKMNGFQVLEKLKEKERTSKIKVYILSNMSQTDEIKKGVSLGADGFLIKANLTPTQIADFIHKVFDNKKTGERKIVSIVKSHESQVKQEKQKGINILLIEDETTIAEMYELRLKRAGYEVKVAKNGAWGLKLSKKKKYDVVVMDVMMPAMNGCEMLKHIKKDSLNHEVPIIVLSNSAQDKEVEEIRKCGAASYLLKSSITPVKLINEIKKVLNN